MIPDAAAEIQSQLAFISAVLGGFSITLAVGLLQLPAERALSVWATGFAFLAGVVLLIATVAGAFGVIWIAERPNLGPLPEMPGPLLEAYRWSGSAFILGVCSLLTSIGLGGWIRSRRLGWATSIVSAIAAAMILYFLIVVVDVV